MTPERLAALLAEQGGRFSLLSPEGGMLRTASGATYSKSGAPSFDVLLKELHPDDEECVRRAAFAAERVNSQL